MVDAVGKEINQKKNCAIVFFLSEQNSFIKKSDKYWNVCIGIYKTTREFANTYPFYNTLNTNNTHI